MKTIKFISSLLFATIVTTGTVGLLFGQAVPDNEFPAKGSDIVRSTKTKADLKSEKILRKAEKRAFKVKERMVSREERKKTRLETLKEYQEKYADQAYCYPGFRYPHYGGFSYYHYPYFRGRYFYSPHSYRRGYYF